MERIGLLMIFILIIFTFLIFHKGRHRYYNHLLGFYLISQIVGIGNNLLFYYHSLLLPKYIHFYMVGFPVLFLWLPFYFFFIRSLLDEEFRINKKQVIHFLPFFVVLLYLMFHFYFKSATTKLSILETKDFLYQISFYTNQILVLQIIVYNIVALRHYLRYKRAVSENSVQKQVNHSWMNVAVFGFMGASLLVAFGHIFRFLGFFQQFNWFIMTNVVFLLFFTLLFYLAIVNPNVLFTTQQPPKYSYSKFGKNELKDVLNRLDAYMLTHELFKTSELSLNELSKKTGIHERCISQAINELKNQNFFDFINGYRVQYATKILIDPNYKNKTMLFILYESGFNSKTTFNNVFKKFTGLTPTQYRKSQLLLAQN